jgi:hypothetical protein
MSMVGRVSEDNVFQMPDLVGAFHFFVTCYQFSP